MRATDRPAGKDDPLPVRVNANDHAAPRFGRARLVVSVDRVLVEPHSRRHGPGF